MEKINATLNKIFIALILIICLLFIIMVGVFNKNNTSTSTETIKTEDSTDTYDVSKFNEKTVTQLLTEKNSNDIEVVYIGRSTCGYCLKFLPILKEAQNNFKYKTTYIDLTKISETEQTQISNLNTFVKENYGRTPMVLLVKNSQYIDGSIGYKEYSEFKLFLEKNGF